MLNATPRLPEEDSTRTEDGDKRPSRFAASTISLADFNLIEPAKLKPSHLRKSERPRVDRRSTNRSSSLNASGADMTGTVPSSILWPTAALPLTASAPL